MRREMTLSMAWMILSHPRLNHKQWLPLLDFALIPHLIPDLNRRSNRRSNRHFKHALVVPAVLPMENDWVQSPALAGPVA